MERKNAKNTPFSHVNGYKKNSSEPINIPQKRSNDMKISQEMDENVNIYNPKKFSSNSWNNRLEKRFNEYYLA